MKLLKTKTVRFADVVKKAGEPEVYTLWLKPVKDPKFQSFLKNNRVMTVQKSDAGTDFGFAGFKESKARVIWFFRNPSNVSTTIASWESIGT